MSPGRRFRQTGRNFSEVLLGRLEKWGGCKAGRCFAESPPSSRRSVCMSRTIRCVLGLMFGAMGCGDSASPADPTMSDGSTSGAGTTAAADSGLPGGGEDASSGSGGAAEDTSGETSGGSGSSGQGGAECEPGWLDCDDEPGCESSADTVATCGSCEKSCEVAGTQLACSEGLRPDSKLSSPTDEGRGAAGARRRWSLAISVPSAVASRTWSRRARDRGEVRALRQQPWGCWSREARATRRGRPRDLLGGPARP